MLRLMRMCVWNSVLVWISYRSFWQKWNFISGDKISCKHYPKWNAYTCPSKYRVVLKCSQNETSYEQNLFSRRFETSNRYEFISPLMWRYSLLTRRIHFHVATHVMCPWSFKSVTSLHHCFFKPIRIFAVDINCYLDLISTNYMCQCLHFVPTILCYSAEWIASWLLKISSGNESRVRKVKMVKWVLETLAKDRDWTGESLRFSLFVNIKVNFTNVIIASWW